MAKMFDTDTVELIEKTAEYMYKQHRDKSTGESDDYNTIKMDAYDFVAECAHELLRAIKEVYK